MRRYLPLVFAFCFFHVIGSAQQIQPNNAFNQSGFIENKGQLRDQNNNPNPAVKFVLPLQQGMNIQLRTNGFSYDTYIVEETEPQNRFSRDPKFGPQKLKPSLRKFKFHRVDVNLIGANKNPQIIAENPDVTCRNYFNVISHGKEIGQVHSYQRVIYKNIYPDIDLVFESGKKGASSTIEYDFIVKPGGDPAKIILQYDGAINTELVNDHIVIGVTKGKFQEHIPESYVDSISANDQKNIHRKRVDVKYRALGVGKFGFQIGKYDRTQKLVIDPTPDLIWGTYLGGTLNDWAYCIAKDASGNIFFGGASDCPELKITAGAYQSTLLGYGDAIIGKFSDQGKLLWLTFYGGSNEDVVKGITVDQNNDVVATGYTFSYDNIATPGAYKTTKISPLGLSDGILLKFSNSGTRLWATYYGGEDVTQTSGIVTDINNNIYIDGYTFSLTGISTPGAFQVLFGGGPFPDMGDGCLAKFNSNGGIVWSTYYGGNKPDGLVGIAIDKMQNIYVTGNTQSPNNIATPNSYKQNYAGGTDDGFIAKFNTNGQRQWASYVGGENEDWGMGICTDTKDNVIVCGMTISKTGIATPGAQQTSFGGSERDGYIAKFSAAGVCEWSTYYGGNGGEFLWSIASDDKDNIAVSGSSYSTDLGTNGTYQPIGGGAGGYWTTILTLHNANGVRQWSTYYGKNGPYGYGDGFAVITAGDYIYMAGETTFTENISTCDAYQKVWGGNQDAFVAKFGKTPDASVPVVTITADANGTICKNKLVTFNAGTQNMGLNYSFQWLWNGNPVGTNSSSYGNSQLAEQDSIRCVVQKNSACATDIYSSNSIIVHIDPALPPSIAISSPTNNICQGEKLAISATVGNAGINPTYQWKINGIPTGIDSSVFVTTSLLNGDKITCDVTHHGSCTIDSIAVSNELLINVKSIQVPSITITASDNPICSGTPVTFQAVTSNTGTNFSLQWQINGENVGANSNTLVNDNLKDNDQVLCLVSSAIPGCAEQRYPSNTLTETVFTTPEVKIEGDTIISKGYSTQLTAISTGNIASYAWSPANSLSNASTANPIATPGISTKYTLRVEEINGCITEKTITVIVLTQITIPNAFTPNGDGKNELFRALYGVDASDVNFSVYNRWGQLVFQDKGNHKGWDGTYGGQQQPAGTYVWVFKYKTATNELKKLKGTVLLIR